MISTVTTTTVTTVTIYAFGGALALVAVLVLLALLIPKELTTTASSVRLERLGRALNIGIVPLLITFVLIVGAKVAQVLR